MILLKNCTMIVKTLQMIKLNKIDDYFRHFNKLEESILEKIINKWKIILLNYLITFIMNEVYY